MRTNLEKWLDLWNEWLAEVLACGVAYPAENTLKKIRFWQEGAANLGFVEEYGMMNRFLLEKTASSEKAKIFQYLLTRYITAHNAFQIQQFTNDVAFQNNTILEGDELDIGDDVEDY